MYHSLTFEMFPSHGSGSIKLNTYDDLHLVPTSRPVIAPPSVNTKKIEIPGANGALDLTESLTPYPTYQNRTGSIEFAVLNDKMYWSDLYSKILNYVHGRRGKMVLEDDQEWYYEGRWAVSDWTSNSDGTWSTVSLEYDLSPYKLSVEDIDENWLWDPFNFETGIIYNTLFTGINVDSDTWVSYRTLLPGDFYNRPNPFKNSIIGTMPVCPYVTFDSPNMGIYVSNSELGYIYSKTYTSAGTYIDPELILYDYLGDGFNVYLKGHGKASINFKKGSL